MLSVSRSEERSGQLHGEVDSVSTEVLVQGLPP